MQITVQDLAALVGGQFVSQECNAQFLRGAASAAEAAPGDVTFFANAKYLTALKSSRATVALVPLDFAEEIGPVAMRVANPSLAFGLVVERFAPAPVVYPAGVHPSAVIGAGVELGEGVSIQPFVVIEAGAKIGARTLIGAHGYVGHGAVLGADCQLSARVTIGSHCILGDRVIVHSGVVVGSDGFGFEFVNGKHSKIAQVGIVQIDSDVEIGANTTVDRARFGRTWIGEGTKIDNLVQIAHNVVVGKHCLLVAQSALAGSCKLGNYVTMAGQTAVVGHVEIADQVTVAARGAVSKNVEAKAVLWGSPAVPIRDAKEQMALTRRLPQLFARVRRMEQVLDASQKSSETEG